MKEQKGSFTIEAIIWIPLILSLMLCTIKEGISFYEKSITDEKVQEFQAWDGVSRFYEIWLWKEMEGVGDNE